MKLFKIITHPVLLTISFCFIVISGEKLSWFYALIVLIGLGGLYLHSILGTLGMLVLLILPSASLSSTIKHSMYLLGACLLILSLVAFFVNDTAHYNWSTFDDATSRFTFTLFGVLWTLFTAKQLIGLSKTLLKKKSNEVSLGGI